MISLEQVRQLDIRVKKAVAAVKKLSSENAVLKQPVTVLESQVDELRKEASDRKADEEQLEMSFQGVLDVLDEVNGETSDSNVVETVPEDKKSPLEENDSKDDILFAAEEPMSPETTETETETEEDAEETETDESDEPSATESQEEAIESEEVVDKPEDVDPDSVVDEVIGSENEDKIQSEFDIF